MKCLSNVRNLRRFLRSPVRCMGEGDFCGGLGMGSPEIQVSIPDMVEFKENRWRSRADSIDIQG